MDGSFCRSTECLRRVRIRQPHKVPANATNSRIQLCCPGPHRLCPSFGKRLLAQSEPARQDASIPQEYSAYLHCCQLPGGLSNRFRPELGVIGIEAEDTLAEDSPEGRVSAGAGTPFPLAADLVPEAPSWLGGCILPSFMARRAAKCLSTSIFLIRLISTPVVLLVSSCTFHTQTAWLKSHEMIDPLSVGAIKKRSRVTPLHLYFC